MPVSGVKAERTVPGGASGGRRGCAIGFDNLEQNMKIAKAWLSSVLVLACGATGVRGSAQASNPSDISRWQQQADRVTIVRDDWGIAHVHGTTDADAVFGMEYAQAEDDFHRIEMNYLTYLGRTAEAEGEGKIWQDLRARMFINEAALRKEYADSPAWLKQLMDAFAD